MTIDADPVWATVISAEDGYGEAAEDHARREAARWAAAGDLAQAAVWEAAANNLHVLHSINPRRTRLREIPMPNAAGPARSADR